MPDKTTMQLACEERKDLSIFSMDYPQSNGSNRVCASFGEYATSSHTSSVTKN